MRRGTACSGGVRASLSCLIAIVGTGDLSDNKQGAEMLSIRSFETDRTLGGIFPWRASCDISSQGLKPATVDLREQVNSLERWWESDRAATTP